MSHLRALLLSTLLPSTLLLTACGEEDTGEENVAPTVVAASATCRSVSGTVVLTSVSFTVEDLNGTMDLGEPVMVVEASRLTPEVEELENDADPNKPVRARYTWSQGGANTEMIFCGEEGDGLQVSFEVRDMAGFPTQEAVIRTSKE